jgi:hypothetical protein
MINALGRRQALCGMHSWRVRPSERRSSYRPNQGKAHCTGEAKSDHCRNSAWLPAEFVLFAVS